MCVLPDAVPSPAPDLNLGRFCLDVGSIFGACGLPSGLNGAFKKVSFFRCFSEVFGAPLVGAPSTD